MRLLSLLKSLLSIFWNKKIHTATLPVLPYGVPPSTDKPEIVNPKEIAIFQNLQNAMSEGDQHRQYLQHKLNDFVDEFIQNKTSSIINQLPDKIREALSNNSHTIEVILFDAFHKELTEVVKLKCEGAAPFLRGNYMTIDKDHYHYLFKEAFKKFKLDGLKANSDGNLYLELNVLRNTIEKINKQLPRISNQSATPYRD